MERRKCMKKLTLMVLIMALMMSLATPLLVKPVIADDSAQKDTISFGNLQKITADANFGLAEGNVVKYGAKTGKITIESKDGIVDFDTKESDNFLKLSSDSLMKFENWCWTVDKDNSIIIVFQAKVDCMLEIQPNAASVSGWVENTNISVYLESNGELTQISHSATTIDSVKVSQTLKAGETLYYVFSAFEIDSGSIRNLQGVYDYTAIATEVKESGEFLTIEEYKAELIEYISTLSENDYSAENWTTIQNIPNQFENEAQGKEGAALQFTYNKYLSMIDAVKTKVEELNDYTSSLVSKFNEKIDGSALRQGVKESDFKNAEDFQAVTALKSEFESKINECETAEKAKELYVEYVAKLNNYAVKTTTVDFLYNLVYDTVEAEFGLYKKFGIVEYGLKWGSVAQGQIKDFDAYYFSPSEDLVYVENLGKGDVAAKNWQWQATKGNGVIAVFKALQDCSINFVCTRVADGGIIGWTVNTTLKVYIGRENLGVKAVYTINTPSNDDGFSGTFYAKAGDIIYYEFTTDHMNMAVNIQTPFATKATIDSTGFDQDAYDEQNNDLSSDVILAINTYHTQLTDYVATLNESDYSATNWSQLTSFPSEFLAAAEEQLTSESTVNDVEALYNTYLTQIKDIKTLAQEAEEFNQLKVTKKEEVKAYANKMLKDNKYSSENKKLIEGYVEEALKAIDEATTTKAINDAVTIAKNKINKVEVKKGGCRSAVSGALSIIVFCVVAFVVNKKVS